VQDLRHIVLLDQHQADRRHEIAADGGEIGMEVERFWNM
jgi:hypothetical protein